MKKTCLIGHLAEIAVSWVAELRTLGWSFDTLKNLKILDQQRKERKNNRVLYSASSSTAPTAPAFAINSLISHWVPRQFQG